MGIVRGRRAGAYVNFSIGTLENGRIDDVEAISIDEDDFYYIYLVVVKIYPAFDLYDLVNPISEGKVQSIIWDLEAIQEWMQNGESFEAISYYIQWLSNETMIPAIEERIAFFDELIEYLHGIQEFDFDYLNLQGF